MRQTVRIVEQPTFEPVTLAQAKLWCKIEDDDTDQDAVLLLLIKAMREHAENLTGRAFVERTLELRLPSFPREILLPYSPVQNVQMIRYVDTDGEWQELSGSPTQWQEDYVSEPARIAPLYQESWPGTRAVFDAVRVTYVAGYENINAIPKVLKLWMEARVGTLFDQRSQIITGTIVAQLPRDFSDALLDSLVLADRLF